jgi:ABC-type bacteriocin/lantibiotic exporter with double-glycine peptidase domain
MFFEFKRLLMPFRSGFVWCLALTFLRQALTVGGGYGFVVLVRTYEHQPSRSALMALALLISWKVLMTALDQFMGWKFSRDVSYPMFRQLSVHVFSTLLSLDQQWHQKGSSGSRRGEITQGVSKFAQTSESIARELCPLLTGAALSLFLLHTYVSPVFWIVILPATCITFFSLSFVEQRRCRKYREERYERYASDYSLSIESLEMRADVVRYNQESRLAEDYDRIHQDIERHGLAEACIQSWFGVAKSAVVLGLQAWLIFHWITLLSAGRLDGAMLVYLYMLSDQLCGSLAGYASLFARIGEAWQPIQSFLKISSATSALLAAEVPAIPQIPARVSLEFRDVAFGYRAGEPVIDRLSLLVEGARTVGFVGRTGCGKSTLLKLVERLYDAQDGSVLVAGKDVREWPLKQLQRICTCLSQHGGVFFSEATLLDTIRFAKPRASFTEVVEAARLACIHEEIMALQDGYQSRAGEHGKNLSGGQRQRVAIAQALLSLQDPEKKVVLLDECTSNLDPETEALILSNIWPLFNGKTVIVVTHRLAAIADLVDEVLVIEEGRVADRPQALDPGSLPAPVFFEPVPC